jgi:hypothetical protein
MSINPKIIMKIKISIKICLFILNKKNSRIYRLKYKINNYKLTKIITKNNKKE